MFIDYVTLLLVNMVAGLVLLALYIRFGLIEGTQHRWVPGFLIVGLVAFLVGLHMTFTWPLPQVYNITHGELSVLFGAVYLGIAFSLGMRLSLYTVASYAFFAGLAAVVVGVRVIHLGLTSSPALSGAGYILTGLAGIFAVPVLLFRNVRVVRFIAIAVLVAAAVIWALTGYGAYWSHLDTMKGWTPRSATIVNK